MRATINGLSRILYVCIYLFIFPVFILLYIVPVSAD